MKSVSNAAEFSYKLTRSFPVNDQLFPAVAGPFFLQVDRPKESCTRYALSNVRSNVIIWSGLVPMRREKARRESTIKRIMTWPTSRLASPKPFPSNDNRSIRSLPVSSRWECNSPTHFETLNSFDGASTKNSISAKISDPDQNKFLFLIIFIPTIWSKNSLLQNGKFLTICKNINRKFLERNYVS